MSFNTKKLKYGGISAAYVALFVAIVIVVNIFAGFLTERFSLKLDMTSGGQYSLSGQTAEILKSLSGRINVYILSTQAGMEKNENSKRTLETVKRYVSASGGKVSYSFIDPNKNPQFFEKYSKAKGAGERSLVVEGDARYTVVKAGELAYTVNGDKANRIFYQSEELISAAILYASSAEVSAAGFITGHNEAEVGALETILSGNNFEISKVDLMSGIPDNVNNLILAAPQKDFTPQELAELEGYLANADKKLYVFWGMSTPHLPAIEEYLSEWGFAFEGAVVCDEKNAYMTPSAPLGEVVSNELIDTKEQGQLMPVFPSTRPVKILFTEKGFTRVVPLMQSMSGSFAKPLSTDKPIESLKRENGDASGPFTLSAICERALGKNGQDGISTVIVFGTEKFASPEIASVTRAYNGEFLTKVVSYANPGTNTMSIKPKIERSYDLNVTEGMAKTLRIILIYVLPIVILAIGIFIYIKRKNR